MRSGLRCLIRVPQHPMSAIRLPTVSPSGPFPRAQFNKEMIPKLTTAYYIHNFKGTRPGGG